MLPYLQRLRQRKIAQWVIAYAAVAWLSLEVFDLVAEQFFWPVWIRQSATILLLFGMFITIVLAWYHGERGRQKVGGIETILLVALLALAGQSVWLLRDQFQPIYPEPGSAVSSFRPEPLPANSVAVLPCLNLSGDEGQAYFADGLAAELITRLSAVSGLRIPSHTSSFSFKGSNVAIKEIASSLRVRHVLECDVSGDESRIRVAARLVDADSGYTLWSESYNRTRAKLFDVQQDVAQAVVDKLEIKLGGREQHLVNRRWTENTEAYDEFLRGIRLQPGFPTVETITASRKHLERAIELDPLFGRAYARLAVHWIFEGNFRMAPAEEAYRNVKLFAARAIELDGELYAAHWALGWAEFAGELAWQEAERHFRKAIELAPGEWGGYHSLGYVLGVLGRTEEGLQAARMAIDVDPLSFFPWHGLEVLLTRQRRYEAAISVIREQADIFGWKPEMHMNMAWNLALLGREEEARLKLSEVEAADSQDPSVQLGMAAVHAMLGERDQALEIVERWDQEHLRSEDLLFVGSLAIIHAILGERELAIQELLETRERREMWLMFLDYEAFDGLRDDPRFVALIRELKLPEDVYLQIPVHTPGEKKSPFETP
jgi:TolB-like protein/Flp pilus assembly protein TadD